MMKQIFLSFLFSLGLLCSVQGQEIKLPQNYQEELMKKSDAQFKMGWILLGTGSALTLATIAIPNNYDYLSNSTNQGFQRVMGWTGFLSISSSIPFFLASGRNGKTAAKISLQSKSIEHPFPVQIRNYPSLALKIPL
jgi:hypothetical protein